MSIDFEMPAEAKAIREKVRKWVHDECIPAEKELDLKPLDEVLGKLRKKARAQGLWLPVRAEGIWRHGIGPARQRAGADGARRKHAGRTVDEHPRPRRCLDDDNPRAWHALPEGKILKAAVERREAHLLLD